MHKTTHQHPVTALAVGLSHQLMCGGIMMAGHVLSGSVPAVAALMAHPAVNIGLASLAGWCWYRGDKGWRQGRGPLASAFEKVAARGVIAAAGLGMMAMHTPGLGLHDHGNHGKHDKMDCHP